MPVSLKPHIVLTKKDGADFARVFSRHPDAKSFAHEMRKRTPAGVSVRVFERRIKVDGAELWVFIVTQRRRATS